MIPLPESGGNRIKLPASGYLKAILITILIFLAIILYVLQFEHFDKILNTSYFLLLSLALGLALGILIGKRYADKEHDIVEKMRLYMICGGLCIVFMPLFIALTNRLLDFKAIQFKDAQLLEFRPQTSQPFGYLKGEEYNITHYKSTLLINEDIFKIKTRVNPFPEHEVGDQILVPVRQGLLGIKYLHMGD